MKSIAIVTPHFPPLNSGVGDYAWIMANEWSKTLDQVHVITAQPQAKISSAKNIKIQSSNSLNDFYKGLYSNLLQLPKETKILFQFTPNMYSRVGINGQLLLTTLKLKFSGRKFSFYFHEKFYPMNLKWPDFFLSSVHRLIYFILKLLSDKVIFSFNENHSIQFPYPVIPVCSNMPIISSDENDILLKSRLKQYFIYFGSTHPSKCVDWVIEAYDQLPESIQNQFPLVIVGSKIENLPCQELIKKRDIRVLGYLSPTDVSTLLHFSSLVLAPFVDGVSSRRGSVLAALSNGSLVITNKGRNTNPEIPWDQFSLVCSSDLKADYTNFVSNAVSQLSSFEIKKAEAKKAYLQFFDSQISAKKIWDVLFLPNSLSS